MNDVASHTPRHPLSRAKAIRISALALAALLLGGYLLLVHNRVRAAAAKGPNAASVPVLVGKATTQDLPVALNGIGTVQPLSVVEVKARVDGQLDKVAFTEGQEVRAGALLAQIDPRPFEAQLAQAEATRAKDQAQLANARSDVTRYSTLLDTGGVAIQIMDAAKAQVAAQEATVRADQAAVDTAKLQLQFTRLVSPIDGRVGLRLVNAGSIVHASDATGIVTVTQMHPISVIFSLPQDELPDILASSSKGKLAVIAYTRDGTRSLAEGELSVVDSQVDSTTGQVRLRAIFANANRTLWPGSLVSARLLVRTDRAVTVIPTRALMRGQSGEYTYVVKADKTVEMRPLTTGQSVDGFTAVLAGVAPGETVVVDGQNRIAPGTHIEAREIPGSGLSGSGQPAADPLAQRNNMP
ncbi:MAG: efflux transporter periplasmic adaptor subunit [Gammaproteobacteria bacterium]|nr:efflux transporter periplasmic adaptor subunit [Gammaproteobacteria bacterium]